MGSLLSFRMCVLGVGGAWVLCVCVCVCVCKRVRRKCLHMFLCIAHIVFRQQIVCVSFIVLPVSKTNVEIMLIIHVHNFYRFFYQLVFFL